MTTQESNQSAAAQKFANLLSALRDIGGFNVEHDSYDLRACMERGWTFRDVALAMAKHKRPIKVQDMRAKESLERAYETAMGDLDFLYTALVASLAKGGYDEKRDGKTLRRSLRAQLDFNKLRSAFDQAGTELSFTHPDDRDRAAVLHKAVIEHKRPEIVQQRY